MAHAAGCPLGVAIVGFGTVGRSVAKILCETARGDLRLVRVCNRDVARKRLDWVPGDVDWTVDLDAALRPDVDVVVELIGGLTPAGDLVRRALAAGKSVVTANKQLVARHGAEFLAAASAHGRQFRFEASVAGGVPVIRAIQDGLAGDRLLGIAGILNGTCNYILTRMQAAPVAYDEALREAQALGFAEADPSEDVDGADAQAKLAILTAIALGRRVDPSAIPRRSISCVESIDFAYAARLGCAIRQIARAEVVRLTADATEVRLKPDPTREGIVAAVGPALVPLHSPFARVEGSRNVVVVRGMFGGETTFSGSGAGGDPTAVAVVSDLVAIARDGGRSAVRFPEAVADVQADFTAPHYVRFPSPRSISPGAVESVFARHRISLRAALDEEAGGAPTPPAVTTEPCPASSLDAALAEIAGLAPDPRPPVCLPMLFCDRREGSS